jgi:methyltransferase (TIGR00027 family)
MDEQVLTAIAAGVKQVVICGAGLDDRALRFRTRGVRFFEVDHPVTQADKADRLRLMEAADDGPVLVSCDLQTGSVAEVLAAHGHDAARPTLFLCEGLLVYLNQQACQRLLDGLARSAASGSVLAVTLATHTSTVSDAAVADAANARRRTGSAEPWLTIMPADRHLAMLSAAGWRVAATEELPSASDDVSHGRRSLLVLAERASTEP